MRGSYIEWYSRRLWAPSQRCEAQAARTTRPCGNGRSSWFFTGMRTVSFCLVAVVWVVAIGAVSCAPKASKGSSRQSASDRNAFVNPMKHNLFSITPQTFETIIGRFRNAHGVSLLLHYTSKDQKQKEYIDQVYNEAAKELKSMVRMAAIDCGSFPDYCKKNWNPEGQFPRVIMFPPYPRTPFPAEKTDKKSLMGTALSLIPDVNVKVLTGATYSKFLSTDAAVPKIVLISAKTAPPVIFKALSNAFSDRQAFGFMQDTEEAAPLKKQYNIKSVPAILAFRAGEKNPDRYDGPVEYEKLAEWLNVRAETFVRGGGYSDTKASDSYQRPWLQEKVPQLNGPSHQDVCFRGSALCAVYLSRGKPTDAEMKELEQLSEAYPNSADRGAQFRWMWLDIATETHYQTFFNIKDLSEVTLPSFAVINPHKRLRYLVLPSDKMADTGVIKGVLEKILSGDARFTIVKGNKIPSFVGALRSVTTRLAGEERAILLADRGVFMRMIAATSSTTQPGQRKETPAKGSRSQKRDEL